MRNATQCGKLPVLKLNAKFQISLSIWLGKCQTTKQ